MVLAVTCCWGPLLDVHFHPGSQRRRTLCAWRQPIKFTIHVMDHLTHWGRGKWTPFPLCDNWEGACQVPFSQEAGASLGKWSIFYVCVGFGSARRCISVHRGEESAWKRFRILVQSREALKRLYEALEGPVWQERYCELLVDGLSTVLAG